VIGISLAPIILPERSFATVLAFFLGLGIGSHALDETMGNPLRTTLSRSKLYLVGFSALSVAIGIGLYYAITLSVLLLPIICAETFFAISYNLETFGSRFHSSWVFSLSWGVLPLITGYFVNALSITPGLVLVSVATGILTYVQRVLSTSARFVRRDFLQTKNLSPLQLESSRDILAGSESALKVLNVSMVILAVALLLFRAL
jgi:hypothetical protein